MTQPIQEPTTDRALQGLAYARDQIFRRPRPSGAGDLPYCYLSWNAGGAVTVNTLTNPISIADYEESFIHDPNGLAGFNPDLTSGCIEWSEPGEYVVFSWVQWDGGSTAGSTLAGVIDRGNGCVFSTFRIVNMIVSDAINDTMRIPVTDQIFSFNPGVFGHDSVRMLVYHTDAGGQDLNSVNIHVIQVNSSVAGDFFT